MEDGYIAAADGVDLAVAIRGYTASLRDAAAQAGQSVAARRMQAARTRALELRTAQVDGLAFPYVESRDVMSEVLGQLKSGLSSVPASVSRDLDVRRQIEAEIDRALHAVCDQLEAGAPDLEARAR